MAHRSSPARIFGAHREGTRQRLIRSGMTAETADRWLDAWVLEATGRGLPRDGRFWNPGYDWIAEERTARSRSATSVM